MKSITRSILAVILLLTFHSFILAQLTDSALDKSRSIGWTAKGNGTENPDSLIVASTYTFSAQSGVAPEDMSGGTTLLIGAGADNDNSSLGQVGFMYRFDDTFYTTFGANANGLIKLGGVMTTTSSVNAISSPANTPKLMPYWDDLCTGSTGKVHYKTVGSPGSRKLVVEWTNMKVTRDAGCNGSGSGTFQLWLFETTGIAQFVYGNGMVASSPLDNGYSVGIQSGATTNFAAVTTAVSTVSYSTANDGQTTAIAAGTSYILSPNMPSAAAGGSAVVTQTTANISWTDTASNETAYRVRRTTDNVNFTVVGNLGANATAFADSGLTPATQYFYYVNALSEGAISPDLIIAASTNGGANITSTATGGLWSASSTWAGGTVPGSFDNVTIASGATVGIDTNPSVSNLTLGTEGSLSMAKDFSTEGGSPARLTFEETVGHTLTVANNLTIGANDIFATGNGSANAHILSVGGNLTNNGTLDLSTNNNQAGATLKFAGAANATFGGTGVVTDVFRVEVNKSDANALVDLTVSNFTVQGSATETAGSGYLYLYGGIFRISGTFTGTHRTFPVAAYDIPSTAGFWLDNPNYTVVAQPAATTIHGAFRVSAGTYNAGTLATHFFGINSTSFILEGGKINVSGAFGTGTVNTLVSGGTLTACIVGPDVNCNVGLSPSVLNTPFLLTGGDVVIQNSGAFQTGASPSDIPNMRGTTVHFGSPLTNGPGTYFITGIAPNVVIDTSSGSVQSLSTNDFVNPVSVNNLKIDAGGIFQFPSLSIHGNTIINNGQLKQATIGLLEFDDLTATTDITYSGSGIMTGIAGQMNIRANSMTFDPASTNLFTVNLRVTAAHLTNANHLTIGNHSSSLATVEILSGASFDSTPDYDLGSGGQKLFYGGSNNIGPEVNHDRILKNLTLATPGSLTLTGGSLATETLQIVVGGVIFTGSSVLSTQLPFGANQSGYVDGNLRMQFAAGHVGHDYQFNVGQNGFSPVKVRPITVNGPSALTIRAVDMTLPGLLPGVSASRYWMVTEEGNIIAQMTFMPNPADINGNQANYKRYRSNGGPPVEVTDLNVDALTGNWGLGVADPGPVSISGGVFTSGGQPIRSALVTISGGNLPNPMETVTGSFGTYSFSGLQAGEVYTIRVDAKRYRFSPNTQTVTPTGNVGNANFTANPQD